MRRTVLLLALVAACDVGALPGFGPDGGGGGSGSADGSGSGSGSATCETIAATPPDGHHNQGLSCIAAGCHLTGQTGAGAPPYTYAGTLYKEAAGTNVFPGATIFVKLGATEKKVVTATNGNFWMTAAPAGLDAPTAAATASTRASGCPTDSMPMTTALATATDGSCNSCHRPGGTEPPIHLP